MDLESNLVDRDEIALQAIKNGVWDPELTKAMLYAYINETGLTIETRFQEYAPHIVEFILSNYKTNKKASIVCEKESIFSVRGAVKLINAFEMMRANIEEDNEHHSN